MAAARGAVVAWLAAEPTAEWQGAEAAGEVAKAVPVETETPVVWLEAAAVMAKAMMVAPEAGVGGRWAAAADWAAAAG